MKAAAKKEIRTSVRDESLVSYLFILILLSLEREVIRFVPPDLILSEGQIKDNSRSYLFSIIYFQKNNHQHE